MKFSLIFSKGKRETERGSSALGKGLVACLLLMSVSCMLFVGTTMSWFTDQKTGTAGVITAGKFDVTLHIGSTTAARGISTNTITMTRVGSNNNLWEPGAVFTSPVMYVENTGTLDLEYRLDLLTARDTAANSRSTGEDTSLLDVIEFRIIDVATDNSLIVNGAVSDAVVNSIFADGEPIDQRTSGAENDTPVVGADGVRVDGVRALKAPTESTESTVSTESTESTVSTESAEPTGSVSGSFIVVGRMKKEADISYSGLTLTAPFTLVVTAQQSGFDWNNTQTES